VPIRSGSGATSTRRPRARTDFGLAEMGRVGWLQAIKVKSATFHEGPGQ